MLPLLLLICCESSPAPSSEGAGEAAGGETAAGETAAGEVGHDHGAGAPPGQSLDAFGSAYRLALVTAGGARCTWQHDSAALRCPDGSQHDVRGLYAWVQEAQDRDARATSLLAMMSTPPMLSWEVAKPLVRLQLATTPEGLSRPLHPDRPQGPFVNLHLALPGAMRALTSADRDALEVDQSQLEAAAIHNTDRIDPEPFWPLANGAARSRVGDGHDGDRLLSTHLDSLGFTPSHALVVPGQLTAISNDAGRPALQELQQTWQAEYPQSEIWWLLRDDTGWRLEQR